MPKTIFFFFFILILLGCNLVLAENTTKYVTIKADDTAVVMKVTYDNESYPAINMTGEEGRILIMSESDPAILHYIQDAEAHQTAGGGGYSYVVAPTEIDEIDSTTKKKEYNTFMFGAIIIAFIIWWLSKRKTPLPEDPTHSRINLIPNQIKKPETPHLKKETTKEETWQEFEKKVERRFK